MDFIIILNLAVTAKELSQGHMRENSNTLFHCEEIWVFL